MESRYNWLLIFISGLLLTACLSSPKHTVAVSLKGQWLTEENGEVMRDPQTSGLKAWRGKLLSLSDGSAHQSQMHQLHIIEPNSASVLAESLPILLSDKITKSCFGPYLADTPDFEALAIDPNDDSVFIVATEDGSRGGSYSEACKQQFKNTGSTEFPSLLVRLKLQDNNTLLMTDVRPVQFPHSYNIGNFPNDGIEGLAFGKDRTLYLGLEKDQKSRARIFSIVIDDAFWSSEQFVPATDLDLRLPRYSSGNHPINGMDYYPVEQHQGFIIAAARNDDHIWVIDLSKTLPTKILPVELLAPSNSKDCKDWEPMDNSSLEGVAVVGDTLMLINDPWRDHYEDNIVCESNRERFEMMAPLLFSMPIESVWFN